MGELFGELKRRNVIKVAIAYLVAAWVVAQIVIAVEAPLHLPGWVDTLVIVLLAIGFPFALIVAWSFERSPEGLKRTGERKTEPASGNDEPQPAVGGVEKKKPAGVTASDASVAVLPFVNMSSDPEQEYFSDGIAEELLNQLAKVKGLHVAGRTSSFHFKGHTGDIADIAAQLKVAHVLEGSVRKAGRQVRITAQLIEAADGYHLWSETYDRELDDIFAIQEDIAHAVTGALSITLGVGELKVGTRNVAAYDAYLAGRAGYNHAGREDWLSSIASLRKATALDAEFVEAQVMLANVAASAGSTLISDRADEMFRIQEEATARAVAIAPREPAVLCIKGLLELTHHRLLEADRLLEEAVQRAPHDAVVLVTRGEFLSRVGRIRESVAALRRWAEVEPLYVQPIYYLALTLETAGQLDQATDQYRLANRLEGNRHAFAGPELVIALTRGDRAAIEAGLEKVLDNDIGLPGHEPLTTAMRDHLDDPEAALAMLRPMLQESEHLGALMKSIIAIWASYFGDDVLALEAYQGLKSTNAPLIWAQVWRPIHRKMRQLPRFKDLLRDLGLVDYWRATGKWGDYVRPVGEDDFECI